MLLGECGYPQVWRQGIARASFRAYERLTAEMPEEADGGGGSASASA